MAKGKTSVFFCQNCGYESAKWMGQCPGCKEWNTFVEETIDKKSISSAGKRRTSEATPLPLSKIQSSDEERTTTGMPELDRVLGGGIVKGSLVLVGGDPGIGKSTLLLQVCHNLCNGAGEGTKSSSEECRHVLYISGEESLQQIKLRADRLGEFSDALELLCETNLEVIREVIERGKPQVVIVDSIQTMYSDEVGSAPGSVSQVREATGVFMQIAKGMGISIFIVGHVTKEGVVAGPRVLEHMVDTVLYFEGDRHESYRILRGVKNRFGSTNEIGVFEMDEDGLNGVENPSEALLAGRPENAPGTCVACVVEGTRPILAEVQALVSPSGYNASRRSNGIDYNRAAMLLAVLEKRGGLQVSGCDTYINVIGGLSLDEPAADLATVLAIASSFLDRPLGADLAAIGEVGLSGEIRSVSVINQRLSEISRLGFRRCVIPAHVKDELKQIEGLKLIPVRNIAEALAAVLRRNG